MRKITDAKHHLLTARSHYTHLHRSFACCTYIALYSLGKIQHGVNNREQLDFTDIKMWVLLFLSFCFLRFGSRVIAHHTPQSFRSIAYCWGRARSKLPNCGPRPSRGRHLCWLGDWAAFGRGLLSSVFFRGIRFVCSLWRSTASSCNAAVRATWCPNGKHQFELF